MKQDTMNMKPLADARAGLQDPIFHRGKYTAEGWSGFESILKRKSGRSVHEFCCRLCDFLQNYSIPPS